MKNIKKAIKTLQENHEKSSDAIIHIFNPYGTGDWWLSEIDEDGIAFGLCDLGFPELGYVSMSELENIKIKVGKYDLPLEIDQHFTPKSLTTIQNEIADR
jgi:hypothetical protein